VAVCPAVLPHAGSGKTLAYLLPAFAHLLASSSSSSNAEQQPGKEQLVQPRVLVLLPSRELAQQVHAQCTALFSVTGISAAVVYGGVPKEAQVGDIYFLGVFVTREHVRHNKSGIAHRGRTGINH
jgi:superfamily II DNA/RNA helicase